MQKQVQVRWVVDNFFEIGGEHCYPFEYSEPWLASYIHERRQYNPPEDSQCEDRKRAHGERARVDPVIQNVDKRNTGHIFVNVDVRLLKRQQPLGGQSDQSCKHNLGQT